MHSSMELLDRIITYIIDPAILLIFSIGFLFFIWGLVVFISNPEDTTKKEKGKQHMIYGIIGMFIMIASHGIINLIVGTFDLDLPGTMSASRGGGGAERGFPTR